MEQTAFPNSVMLAAGKARGEVGMARVAERAEKASPGWCDLACGRVRALMREQSGMLTMELIRLQVEKHLPPATDKRAWGVVTRMAAARGYIERVPNAYFPAASSNASPKPLWKRGPKA